MTNTMFGVDESYTKVKFIGKENDTILDIDINRHTGELFTSHAGYIKHSNTQSTGLSWTKYAIEGN